MSGFIANAGPTAAQVIANAPFWPAIDSAQVRATMRLDGSVTDERLRAALIGAVLEVNGVLQAWQVQQQASGYARLVDLPDVEVGGAGRRVHLYLRAIGCATAAELTERYRSYDATSSANQRADDLAPSIDELRRDLAWALSDLQDRPRSTVELI